MSSTVVRFILSLKFVAIFSALSLGKIIKKYGTLINIQQYSVFNIQYSTILFTAEFCYITNMMCYMLSLTYNMQHLVLVLILFRMLDY